MECGDITSARGEQPQIPQQIGKKCVKIKLHRDPTSQKSDLYEFKMALFDNGDLE